jgi:genome maintenance exonuclease 1
MQLERQNKFNIFPQQFTKNLCESVDGINGGPRIYTTIYGNQYPSITSILSATMSTQKKDILDDWKAREGEENAEKIKVAASDRGSFLHNIIEKYLFGDEEFYILLKAASPKLKRLFNQVKPYLDKNVNNIRLLEKPLFSDTLKIAGKVDMVAEYNRKLSVVDFKTSTRVKTLDMIDDYLIQETFYSYAYAENFCEKIEQIVTIIATENSLKPYIYIQTPREHLHDLNNRINQYYKQKRG